MRKYLRIITSLLMIACFCVTAACAATERGSLEDRFADVLRVEYEGKNYSLRNRLTTVLAMAVSTDELGGKRADFARILVVDDAQKIFSMINIPHNTLVQVPAENESGFNYMRFADVYAIGSDPDASCAQLIYLANAMLGYDLVDSYIAFDLDGLTVLNGGQEVEGTTREKLGVLKEMVEGMSTDELNGVYAQLGDYIITDMKSGAVMKIADKAERYERVPTDPLPGAEAAANPIGPVLVPDAGELHKLMIRLFFEESVW